MLLARVSLLSLATVMFCACSVAKATPGPPPPCSAECETSGSSKPPNTTSSGSGGGGGAGGNGQGGGETVTVTGNVEVVNGLAFTTIVAYTKPAFVYGDGLSGKQIGAEYNGAMFTLEGIASGDTWFYVGPKDSSDTVLPTYSKQSIPTDKLVLQVLDQQLLSTIGLSAGLALSTQQAQIVLRVTDGKKPLAGVSAQSAGAGLILYDIGADYSAEAPATNARGIIILLNQSSSSITLTDSTAHTYQVDVRADPGSATLLDLVL